ncbi:MAG: hypothetical protein ISN29_01345 [Gammaproteobacteria bacterium AqS3]|nr:hypothetical protein [Gammaproteobacteria bacterium AqS3]
MTVSARHDADSTNDNATIILSGTGVGTGSVKVTVIDDDAAGAGFNVSGVLMQLDGDDAEGLAVQLAARHGNKLTDNWQIFGRSDAMLDIDRVVSSNLSVLALKVHDWNVPQAATVRAKPASDKAGNMIKVSFARVGQQRCGAKSLVLSTAPLQMAGGCGLKQCCKAVVNVERKQTRKLRMCREWRIPSREHARSEQGEVASQRQLQTRPLPKNSENRSNCGNITRLTGRRLPQPAGIGYESLQSD